MLSYLSWLKEFQNVGMSCIASIMLSPVEFPIKYNYEIEIYNTIIELRFRLSYSKARGLQSGLNICYLTYLSRYIYKLDKDFKNFYWEERRIFQGWTKTRSLSCPQKWYCFPVGTFGKWGMSVKKQIKIMRLLLN